MKTEYHSKRFLAVFYAVLFSVFVPTAPAFAAGLATTAPAVLYDSHSQEAQKLFVLTAGQPLQEISYVDGWYKVSTFNGRAGWISEKQVRPWRGVVVLQANVAVLSQPAARAPVVFYASRGVTMETLAVKGAWVEVLHKDGETGYVPRHQVWVNQ